VDIIANKEQIKPKSASTYKSVPFLRAQGNHSRGGSTEVIWIFTRIERLGAIGNREIIAPHFNVGLHKDHRCLHDVKCISDPAVFSITSIAIDAFLPTKPATPITSLSALGDQEALSKQREKNIAS
jgi:hypothetical protein